MLNYIDNFLNRITMYKFVLYYLGGLLGVAFILSLFGKLPFEPISFAYSIFFVTLLSWIINSVSASWFKVPANVESVYITAFILLLLITPVKGFDLQYFGFLAWATILAQASKYVLAIYRKHIFNPAALAVAITAIFLNQSASWWVGTAWMLPFVVIGGVLMVRKLRRFDLVISFLITALLVCVGFSLMGNMPLIASIKMMLISSPLFFLAFVMLTEPLTTPPTKGLQIVYGAIVGFLFAPQMHILNIYSTPELALLIGNIYSYAVSPKKKLLLSLKEKVKLGTDAYNFVFNTDTNIKYTSGQYLEWTLAHEKHDSRGNRRYFTIASSPTEKEIIMGVKFYNPSSSFKKALLEMKKGDTLLAGQLAGDFTLPKNPLEKSVFIAGGIGITPFRSMIKYLIDTNQKRDITLFFSNKTTDEIVYKDIFDEASKKIGLKVVYTLSDTTKVPKNWSGQIGMIDSQMITKQVPDFKDRTFYISGPHGMVTAFENTLSSMGISKSKIKTDFFPGFV